MNHVGTLTFFIIVLRMWKDQMVECYDCGDEVGSWLDSILDRGLGTTRLMWHHPQVFDRSLRLNDEWGCLFEPERTIKVILMLQLIDSRWNLHCRINFKRDPK